MKKHEFERELERAEGLRQLLMAYSEEHITQVSQRAACSILHRMEQRLAVWLLMLIDRLDSDVIEITQERMAQHLGVRRADVTLVAGELQGRGIISYNRGSLRVVNRQALETVACECYGTLAREGQQTASI
ncbi:MAG: Crp/Fnr family transcriptional regulator [Pyrinomonadaceae bacterium]|nr:Crp/Fnr family transcriptional regulator [Pyrinomonadaceae bacterium]